MSSARPFVVAFFVGVISAVAGLLLVGWLADQSVDWYSISSFEGGSGYFVVFLALGGGIAGFFIGVIGAWWATTRGATFVRSLGLVLAVDVGLVAIATLLAWGLADHPPTIDGRPLVVELELMTPEGPAPVDAEGFRSSLAVMTMDGDTGGYGSLEKDAARAEGARWIISASVPLGTSVPQKQTWVSWAEGEALYFPLPLPSRPTEDDFVWSDWRGPSNLYRDGTWIEGDALPDFRIRTRVQFEPPPEPPPTDAEVAAERDSAEAAALAAVPADAPLATWLPFTRVEVSEARRADVLTRIAARPNFAADLRALALGEDAELAAEALRLVSALPASSAAWRDAVRAAGQDLVARTERGILVTEADDPSYEWAAALSIRFGGWLHVSRLLREQHGDDHSAELRAILHLARRRPDSYVMQQDIVRVASFYLRQWTGEAPLPTDPPPR
jgi:hypothetical protein